IQLYGAVVAADLRVAERLKRKPRHEVTPAALSALRGTSRGRSIDSSQARSNPPAAEPLLHSAAQPLAPWEYIHVRTSPDPVLRHRELCRLLCFNALRDRFRRQFCRAQVD